MLENSNLWRILKTYVLLAVLSLLYFVSLDPSTKSSILPSPTPMHSDCVLEHVDPWDRRIQAYINFTKSIPACNVTQDRFTDLTNGVLRLLKPYVKSYR